ncbi:MAG TPA: CHAT domain-containing protein [Herpetosiphonaceae bacterium]|nr:CHAT domain-containing protein [Herpetosiphonaceae bacterium]
MTSYDSDASVSCLIAYWQQAPLDLATRAVCGRLADLVLTHVPAGQREAVRAGAADQRAVIQAALAAACGQDLHARLLAASLAPPAPPDQRGVKIHQAPMIIGNGNTSFNAGRDMRITGSVVPAIDHSALDVLRVLFIAADPSNTTRLRLDEEYRQIQQKLRLAPMRDRIVLEQPRLAVRPDDLSEALLDRTPFIVHFAGHGTQREGLLFDSASGSSRPVKASALARLFSLFRGQIGCVILNACYSETVAQAIAQHIGCVIGMNQAIGDDAAIAFSTGFYQALGAGRSPAEAFEFGLAMIDIQNLPGHLIPVLLKAAP